MALATLNILQEKSWCVKTLMVLFLFFQEWPEEDYPPYANGPGYILSSDIARYIVSEFEMHKLRVSISKHYLYCSFRVVLYLNE